MKFLEALQYCKDTGNAITSERYTEESQKSVQWYLNKDQILVCQNYTKKPEIKSINKDYWIDEWIPYPGEIKKWEDYHAEILTELHELENEIGPLMEKIERYRELKARYDIDN